MEMQFKLWLEKFENYGDIRFLVNPTKQQLWNFVQKARQQYGVSRNYDYDIRGLNVNGDIYWWPAYLATHYQAAQTLKTPYDIDGRLIGYINTYGDVEIDYDHSTGQSPHIKKLGLDDGRVLLPARTR